MPRPIRARTFRLLLLATAIAAFAPSSASAAPAITISGVPSSINTQGAMFSLSLATGAGKAVDFYCSMDNPTEFFPCDLFAFPNCVPSAGGQSCTLSKRYATLGSGPHVFRAFAAQCDLPCDVESAEDIGPITEHSFTVDRTAPIVTLASGPSISSPVLRGGATFSFTVSEPATTTCAIDGDPPEPCTSPVTFRRLSNDYYSLTIVARDFAGNQSAPLTVEFRVDVFKPKKCKRGKTRKGKAKYRKCVKANARANARWKRKYAN